MGFDPNEPCDSNGRWGRMNSTSRAKLTASAQFSTKTKPGKAGKLPTLGKTSPRMQADKAFGPSVANTHAVAIVTAKALDKDFHNARDKANKDAMHHALAKTKVPVIKYPSQKPKKR
jgi:hypothetical protein